MSHFKPCTTRWLTEAEPPNYPAYCRRSIGGRGSSGARGGRVSSGARGGRGSAGAIGGRGSAGSGEGSLSIITFCVGE